MCEESVKALLRESPELVRDLVDAAPTGTSFFADSPRGAATTHASDDEELLGELHAALLLVLYSPRGWQHG